MTELYESTIHGEWGLKNNLPTSYDTIQGVNYRSTENPVDFSDCWVVRNTRIGDEEEYTTHDGRTRWGYKSVSDNSHLGSQIGGLFFISAPNAAAMLSNSGSTKRTLNLRATDSKLVVGPTETGKEDVIFFLAGLEAAITGAIDAAIKEQLFFGKPISVLVFNQVGGGIYWPRKGEAYSVGDRGQEIAIPPKSREMREPKPNLDTYKNIIDHVLDGTVLVPPRDMGGKAFQVKKKFFFDHILVTGL